MIDFHSHILPGMDDGSRCPDDSVEMLRQLQRQHVDTVALTPHFFGERETSGSFFERRDRAYGQLRSRLPAESPRLLLGAEVKYYRGISTRDDLKDFCMEGTRILLLEMPFSAWSEKTVNEVCHIAERSDLTVMLAHIERYFFFQRASVWRKLRCSGVIMQSNAEFFFVPVVRCFALHLLRRGNIHVLGTDAHNLTTRAPRMERALDYIQDHLGEERCAQFCRDGETLLQNKVR